MTVRHTKQGTWEVRWRDAAGSSRRRRFKDRVSAAEFEDQVLEDLADGVLTPHLRGRPKGSTESTALARALAGTAVSLGLNAGSFDPRGWFVYLLWGGGEWPIYVGMSGNVLARLGKHAEDPGKRKRLEKVTMIKCASRNDAVQLEAFMISYFRPDLNRLGLKPKPIPKEFAS